MTISDKIRNLTWYNNIVKQKEVLLELNSKIDNTSPEGSESQINKQNSLAQDGTGNKYPTVDAVRTHTANLSNPHSVTKSQVGLSNVDNTSDANKPTPTATQEEIDLKVDKVSGERLITTSEIVKLENQSNTNSGDETADSIITKIGSGGLINQVYLPSYIDDVLEFANLASFPAGGENGKIYVAIDTSYVYRWTGSEYLQITNGIIGSTADVPENSLFLYFTTARVLATILTGVSFVTSTAVLATDSIVIAFGKLQAQLTNGFTTANIKSLLGITTLTGSNTGDDATNTQYSGLSSSKANLAGTQTFTGIHNFPTPTLGTNTTQVATTEFVKVNTAHQVKDFYTDVSNITTTETDLLTYTTVANRLNTTGEKLVITYGGTFNDTTATSQLRIYYAGQVIGNTGVLTISATGAWVSNISIIRTGTTTARAILNISTPGASTAFYTNYASLTGLTFTGTNIVKITGTAGGATGGSNDITATYGNIIWQPAAI
jgi:hypothetical protein